MFDLFSIPNIFEFSRRVALGAFFRALYAGSSMAFELHSGLKADLSEVLVDNVEGETWLRFRFVAPAIDRAASDAVLFSQIEPDFTHLCRDFALPYEAKYTLDADMIVISISDRAVDFGTTDPDATQYFEQFRAEGRDCIWEGF